MFDLFEFILKNNWYFQKNNTEFFFKYFKKLIKYYVGNLI